MNDDTHESDAQYKKFLEFLFDRYVRPRASLQRAHFHRHVHGEWSFALSRAIRATRLLRFIETHFDDTADADSTIKLEALRQACNEVFRSARLAERVVHNGGFLDAFKADPNGVLDGIRAEHLPAFDKEVLREIGTSDADAEMGMLVRNAKAVLRRSEPDASERYIGKDVGELSVSRQLKQATERAEREVEELDEAIRRAGPDHPKEAPKKPRRWFKGFGQIGQGAALTIANAGLAFGAIHVPVAVETQTWGAIVSVVTGIGTILNGVGDLRNE